jgi:hypothetical protein
MLWIFLLDCVLRASVAPQGFALGSSSWLFACGGSDRGRMIARTLHSIIGITPPHSAFRLSSGDALGY